VETFFHDVELVIHLDGEVFGVAVRDPDISLSPSMLGLPETPRMWGPRQRGLEVPYLPFDPHHFGHDYAPPPPPSMSWNNTGAVTFRFDIGDLRPRETYRCLDSDVILVISDPAHAPVRGTWTITARDHHHVYEGGLSVPADTAVDLTPDLLTALELAAEDGDE
jgi:hypothetical protein